MLILQHRFYRYIQAEACPGFISSGADSIFSRRGEGGGGISSRQNYAKKYSVNPETISVPGDNIQEGGRIPYYV